jgi:hypothetical protein
VESRVINPPSVRLSVCPQTAFTVVAEEVEDTTMMKMIASILSQSGSVGHAAQWMMYLRPDGKSRLF